MVKTWTSVIFVFISLLTSSHPRGKNENGVSSSKERSSCHEHPVIDYFSKLSSSNRSCFDINDELGKVQYYVFDARFQKCPLNDVNNICTLPLVVEADTSSVVFANLYCPLHEDNKQYSRIIHSTNIINGTVDNKIIPLFYAMFSHPLHKLSLYAVCAFGLEDLEKVFGTKSVLIERNDSTWTETSMTELVEAKKFGILAKNLIAIGDISTLGKKMENDAGQITSLAVRTQVISLDDSLYDIIYFGNSHGYVTKGVPFQQNHHPLAHWNEVRRQEIDEMTITNSSQSGKLFVYMKNEEHEVPLEICATYRTCKDCKESQDPDCIWNDRTFKCEFFIYNVTHESIEGLYQDVKLGDTTSCDVGTTKLPELSPNLSSGLKDKPNEKATLEELITKIEDIEKSNKKLIESNEKVIALNEGLLSWIKPAVFIGFFIFGLLLSGVICTACKWQKIKRIYRNLTQESRPPTMLTSISSVNKVPLY